jgi:hypothetical protein
VRAGSDHPPPKGPSGSVVPLIIGSVLLRGSNEVVITENNQPVAKLVSELPKPKPPLRPPPGLGKGFITIISDDDEHLKDFAEYMP